METKIKLKIRVGKRIVAKEVDAGDTELPHKDNDGSVEGVAGDTIEWKNRTAETLVLKFYRKGDPNPDWPFEGSATSLTLPAHDTKTATLKDVGSTAFSRWKYEVMATTSPDIDPLDPMIIIRGKSSRAKLALIAGISLVTGLVIGLLWNSINQG